MVSPALHPPERPTPLAVSLRGYASQHALPRQQGEQRVRFSSKNWKNKSAGFNPFRTAVSFFGDNPLKFQVVCPQIGAAVLKGLNTPPLGFYPPLLQALRRPPSNSEAAEERHVYTKRTYRTGFESTKQPRARRTRQDNPSTRLVQRRHR